VPPAHELTDKYPRLGAIISQVQSRFILGGPPAEVFDPLLTDLLEFTLSEYGFIAEVLNDAQDGHCFLRVSVLTDVSWDDATRAMFERHRSGEKRMEFHQLDTLFGAAVTTGQPVIANDPIRDPRWSGRLPSGHMALEAFLGLPLFHGGELVGVVGLANRAGGYQADLVEFLQPLTASVGAILGAVRLHAARHEAEQALRASEERLRATFEMAAVGIAHVSPQGRFVRVNRKLCDIFGRSAAQMVALDYLEVTLPDDRATDASQVQRLLAGEVSGYVGQKRYLHADGHTIWCNLSVALVRDAAGAPEYFIAVVEDITGRKQVEAAMLAAQAAERANAAKTEFLSHMSHELRTPLNAVLGFAQLLRLDATHPLVPVQRDMVRHIEDAGLHLLSMIDDVLDLARIEGAGFALEPVAVPLDTLLGEAVALVAGMARDADVRIERAHAPAPAHVLADHRRARQVFVNLLSNAVKYNHRGGRVTLSWRDGDEPGTLRVEVADTGPGLSTEQIDHLFEPFNRLGAERSPVQGTGIGLVITRRLVHLMGGRLQVESHAGAGSRFSVLLPAAAAPEMAVAPDASVDAHAAPAGAPARRSVLYAEDNPMNIELMRELMRLRPACSLTVAHSGAQAIELARSCAPDLLLLDMHLGDMTALDVKQRLEDVSALATLPWVVLSADAMPATIAAAREAGFAEYLTKPLEVARFLRCIDERLGIEGSAAG
jgi:PAS domain S-box-containing protein